MEPDPSSSHQRTEGTRIGTRILPAMPPRILLQTLFPHRANDSLLNGLSLHSGKVSEESGSPESRYSWRPHVTLTFAQSIDAKIAGKGGKQLILSGRESMVMTHW